MITQIDKLPDGFERYISESFDEYDTKKLPFTTKNCWYWYATAPYEGAGNIIINTEDGLWHHHDCGHCSCYGPLCRLNLTNGEESLDALLSKCSEDLQKELSSIIEAIKTK